MSRTFINQSIQIANSNSYDDTLPAGASLEFSGSNSSIHDDLNALRSMIRHIIGTAHWYDEPTMSFLSVSGSLSEKLNLSGDTMTGPLSMGSNAITDVTDPVSPQQAATKAYVDAQITELDSRSSKSFSVVTTAVLANSNLMGGVGGNLDAELPTFSSDLAVFTSSHDIFLNGQILRPGTDMDVYPGTVSKSVRLTFDAVEGDVFCIISYA